MLWIICLHLCSAEKAAASCRFWQMINLRNVLHPLQLCSTVCSPLQLCSNLLSCGELNHVVEFCGVEWNQSVVGHHMQILANDKLAQCSPSTAVVQQCSPLNITPEYVLYRFAIMSYLVENWTLLWSLVKFCEIKLWVHIICRFWQMINLRNTLHCCAVMFFFVD